MVSLDEDKQLTEENAALEERIDLREALPIVWQLAWPAVSLNGLQTVNSLLDSYFVGKLEVSALTAHGAGLNIIFLLFSLAMTVSIAATALVARAYGAGDVLEYRKACEQCLRLANMVGLGMALLAAIAAVAVVPYLVPAGNVRAAELLRGFLFAWSAGLFANTIIQTLAGSLRGIGDTKSPMFVSGLQILLHIVLNYLFIFPTRPVNFFGLSFQMPGLGLGFPGAAWALSVSSVVSLVGYLWWVRRTELQAHWSLLLPAVDWTRRIMKIALPSAMQALLRVSSFTVFTIFLRNVPDANAALGALRVGIALEAVMFMPAFGFSVAASALVGQNLGAKNPGRAERMGWVSAHLAALVILVISIPLFIWADPVAALLTGGDKPLIQSEAVEYLRWIIATEVLFGYAMVLSGALQGAGDAKRTMWITLLALWLVRVPLAYVLSETLGMGATGCWIAMSFSQAIQGLLCIFAFRQGKWKTVKV